MPKKIVFVISLISIGLGFIILGLSLLMTSPAYRVEEGGKVSRTFYIGQEILPDHIIYPALNLQDRMAVSLAKEQDKDLVEISVAQKRLNEARALQMKNPKAEALIVRTLQKSDNYFQQGMVGLSEKDWEVPEKIVYISELLRKRRQVLNEMKADLSDPMRSKIDEIITAEDFIQQQLWAKYGTIFKENKEMEEIAE